MIVSNQKLGIEEAVLNQTLIQYTLKDAVKVVRSDWQVDAVIHNLMGLNDKLN